jgi:lipooligosaccharide transport system permease protein
VNALAATRAVPIPPSFGTRRSVHMIERNMLEYRRVWIYIVSGAVEPIFYLASIGVGLGKLVPHVTGPAGQPVRYIDFVAPALLATAAMQGAVFDATFTIFQKLKYSKTYDAILVTPLSVGDIALGEIGWALLRGALYATTFLIVALCFGAVHSWFALLALPAATLIGFAFASLGMAVTTFMRSWLDFEWVTLAMMPMFLFSTTFFPLSVYPRGVQICVECTPLYQGIQLVRGLMLGSVGPGLIWNAVYLVALGLAGLVVVNRRLGMLLLR